MTKLKRLIPNKIKTYYAIRKEKNMLRKFSKPTIDLSSLRAIDELELAEIFNSPMIGEQWNDLAALRSRLRLPNLKGGVNVGDQRAIYHMLKGLNVKKVLEIGTHIGASSAHICLALKDQEGAGFVTVDIKDVNDPNKKPWLHLNSPHSPKELITQVGGGDFTRFVESPSLDFMRSCTEKFDFIFLDGDHRAFTVYQEIPVALKLLNPGGVILLHDHYPDNLPLWSDGKVSPGTYIATQRLINENSSLEILPLGNLPWETKLKSHKTSLALVTAGKNNLSGTASRSIL